MRDTVGRERVGRYGWKADIGTLEQFVAVAFRNELGIASPLAPDDLVTPQAECARTSKSSLEDDGTLSMRLQPMWPRCRRRCRR